MRRSIAAVLTLAMGLPTVGYAAAKKKPDTGKPAGAEDHFTAGTFSGLELRGIGPAITSGRIADVAVDPTDASTRYVAAASGGVWKTTNAGTTWRPIFDDQGSYSIGCVAVDPNDPLVVWVGSGENNSQRSVSYGDGVYKSLDGGTTWKNVGLADSEHIAKILIDPRDSRIVYVAAQGPLWRSGGDRGLYKSTDGGKTWSPSLRISDDTGVTDVWFDPRDPDTLYAAAYQRRRHVWTLIDGGPESAIYKSTDAGASWSKLTNGLPKEDMGRIGLAVSPADPNVVYAIIEAARDAGGFFRSRDGGANWEKMSDYVSGSPQYYQEIIPDPREVGRVYSMDTWMMVTEDGGKSFHRVGERYKHVDNHALWIDPADTGHLIAGCDGGVYETFDRGATWAFSANLPVTQFYNVAVDHAAPFYNVYGGTQDNNTLGGPSRTRTVHGIVNSEWFVTVGGDGFQTQVDPENPDIVYSEYQYGGLVRFDRATGEALDIQPQPGAGEPPLRFNWDSPLVVSPHLHTRLYFAAQRIFRSDDRGDTWRAVSPDLTRQIDRNKLAVMGRVWSVDAVAKNASTSFYGNIVALAESPLVEGLLYAGTDDGLIQVSEDGGEHWREIASFPGVPDRTYVADLEPSPADADTVFATFDNHKMGDFAPYALVSRDRGRSWKSIVGDLPKRGSVHNLIEDAVDPSLLFAGTEFGLYFSPDGGGRWIQLQGGLPVIAVRDLVIQRQTDDLVVATFGRGFYVLDDLAPLRRLSADLLDSAAASFAVRPAYAYIPTRPMELKEKSFQGDAFFSAPNPPFGAVFTYYLEHEIQTLAEQRKKNEAEIRKRNGEITYPSWSELLAESREKKPVIVLTVEDADGNVVRRLTGPVGAGFHRVAWDLRYPTSTPPELHPGGEENPFEEPDRGPMVVPGTYRVSFAERVRGKLEPIAEPRTFQVTALGMEALSQEERAEALAFERKTARLQRAVLGSVELVDATLDRLALAERALSETTGADQDLRQAAETLESRLKDLQVELTGDRVVASHNEPTPPSIVDRVQGIVFGQWGSSAAPTATQRQAYTLAAEQFAPVLAELHTLVEVDLAKLEERMEAIGAPWTPGRVPTWKPE